MTKQTESQEKRLNGYLSVSEHERLNDKLKALTKDSKVSVSDYVIATLDIPNEQLQPLIDKVIAKKYSSKKIGKSLASQLADVSEEARRQIEAILAREAAKQQ